MSNDPNAAADPAAEPTAQGAGSPSGQPEPNWESDDNPYKKRFSGMQVQYQKVHGELESWKGKHFDLDTQFKTVLGERDALTQQFATLKGDHERIVGEKTGLAKDYERLKLISTAYPDLLTFEKDGLLPNGTGDELKAKLDTFKARLSDMGKQAAVEAMQGASPAPTSAAQPKTAQELLKAANQLILEGKTTEGNAMMDRYLAEMLKR